jgi:hypothetical protein
MSMPALSVSRSAAAAFARLAWVALSLAAALGLALSALPARADEGDLPGRVGRVALVAGTVRTVDADGAWVPLPRNRPLTTGDRVVTEADGRATLEVGSSTFRLGPSTDVHFVRLDDEKIVLHFSRGVMALRVHSADVLGEISVETDEGAWVPHHAGYYRFDRAPDEVLSAMAWSGDMLLEAPDSSLPVAANQRVEVWQEGAQQTTHYRRAPIPSDDFAAWALAQDKLDDRAHAASHSASAPVPDEMTGGDDLSQYGTWAQSADYGPVWYPAGVPSGWAPYTDGSWYWSVGWGWTWLDYAPWGFAPFHYGRWAWIGGRWGWCPGAWGPRPIYSPALVGWVGGTGFYYGGYPWVGWVPLAPHEVYYPAYPISIVYWNGINGGHVPPPINRPTPYPITSRPRSAPTGPVNYANRGAPGAVSMAPAQSLTQRQPMPVQRTPGTARFISEVATGKAQMLPPPSPPQGRGAPGAGVGGVARGVGRPGAAPPGARGGVAESGGPPAAPGAAAAPAAPNAPNAGQAPAAPGAGRGGPSGRSSHFVSHAAMPVLAASQAPGRRVVAGAAPVAFNAPPTQFNAPPSQFNAPPTPFNAPPTPFNAPPSRFNAPPSGLNSAPALGDGQAGPAFGSRGMATPVPMGQPPAPAFGSGAGFGFGGGSAFTGARGGHQ